MKFSTALRRELRHSARERDAMLVRLINIEREMPKRPIDPDTGQPGEYRSRPFRIADKALQLCREALQQKVR